MRFRFIERHRQRFSIQNMCRVLAVSRAGYYAWRKRQPSARQKANEALMGHIRQLFEHHHHRYGYRRIHAEVRRQTACGVHRVARLMRQAGLQAVGRKRSRRTTQSDHQRPIAPNILGRSFAASAPNEVWLTDITYVPTDQGWLYVSIILDLYARRIVGWAMETTLADRLTRKALTMALQQRRPAPALLHHSDRGSQYASQAYRQMLLDRQAVLSMSRKGDVYDNAPMESFFATLKKELIHREHYQTQRQARSRIFEYIEGYYNPVRIHSALQYYSPMAYEALFVVP